MTIDTSMNYNNLLTFGDVIELRLNCDVSKLLYNIKQYEWKLYNPLKNPLNPFGLSVTSLDGNLNGIDIGSITGYNKEKGTSYDESSFKTFTDVYKNCYETRKLVEPFEPWLGRTHYLNFKKGRFFPPHRDIQHVSEQESFRILVPLECCNPPRMFFMYDGKPLHFNMGAAYFINTNKMHSVFSYEDNAYMMVMNVECNEESLKKVGKLMRWK